MADSSDSGWTRSEVTGTAGQILQARDVSGGVQIHQHGPWVVTLPQELPGVVRTFINHEAQLARLDEIAARSEQDAYSPVVVVHGTAGVGKTTMVLEWSQQAARSGRFGGGQLYVNLRGYDPGQPVSALAALEGFLRSLGVPAADIPADLETRAALYRSRVAGRRLLIVLDNAATVAQVRALLPGAPGTWCW